jgi:fatty acid desaturase
VWNRQKAITKRNNKKEKKEATMIWTIFVILVILWLLGFVSSYTMGGFIHILLVVAVIVLVVGLFQRR